MYTLIEIALDWWFWKIFKAALIIGDPDFQSAKRLVMNIFDCVEVSPENT